MSVNSHAVHVIFGFELRLCRTNTYAVTCRQGRSGSSVPVPPFPFRSRSSGRSSFPWYTRRSFLLDVPVGSFLLHEPFSGSSWLVLRTVWIGVPACWTFTVIPVNLAAACSGTSPVRGASTSPSRLLSAVTASCDCSGAFHGTSGRRQSRPARPPAADTLG